MKTLRYIGYWFLWLLICALLAAVSTYPPLGPTPPKLGPTPPKLGTTPPKPTTHKRVNQTTHREYSSTEEISTETASTLTLSPNIAAEIEQQKGEFCAYGHTIDAATMSTTDYNKVLLFAGEQYFEMDLETATLVNTRKIKDTWPELESKIDAACSVNIREPGGFLFTKGSTFWLYLSATEPTLVNTSHMNDYLQYYGMEGNAGERISCLTCYCKDFYDCKITALFKDDPAKSITCQFDLYLNLQNCEQKNFIRSPADLSTDLLNNMPLCNGISYVVGLTSPSTVFFADENEIHFWKGNNKIYAKQISELFGCFTMMGIVIIGGIILLLIVIVIIVVIIVCVTKSSKTGMDDEATVVSDAYAPEKHPSNIQPNITDTTAGSAPKGKAKDKKPKRKRLNM